MCDRQCCGYCCCTQPAPKPVSAVPPDRPGSEKHDLAVLAQVDSLVAENGDREHPACAHSSLDEPLAVASLQSQHVRIQT